LGVFAREDFVVVVRGADVVMGRVDPARGIDFFSELNDELGFLCPEIFLFFDKAF